MEKQGIITDEWRQKLTTYSLASVAREKNYSTESLSRRFWVTWGSLYIEQCYNACLCIGLSDIFSFSFANSFWSFIDSIVYGGPWTGSLRDNHLLTVLFHDILQIAGLLDRLVKKEDQTATVPLLADIPPYVDNCKIVVCNERGGNTIQTFGNTANKSGTNTAE